MWPRSAQPILPDKVLNAFSCILLTFLNPDVMHQMSLLIAGFAAVLLSHPSIAGVAPPPPATATTTDGECDNGLITCVGWNQAFVTAYARFADNNYYTSASTCYANDDGIAY